MNKIKAIFPKSGHFIQTYFTPCSSVSIVNFEQVNAGWVEDEIKLIQKRYEND